VIHGDTVDGFVALDDIIFSAETECPFAPAQAWPQEPTTTPIPTEPPDGKTHNMTENVFFYEMFSFNLCLAHEINQFQKRFSNHQKMPAGIVLDV
jgi:hypothetical protein